MCPQGICLHHVLALLRKQGRRSRHEAESAGSGVGRRAPTVFDGRARGGPPTPREGVPGRSGDAPKNQHPVARRQLWSST
ncbi:hypothetical protein ACFU8Q_00765 [Streptomyces sp. NPDC057543]|uniref:hypothetical protein n=1 Tax=Streptomyces sp. NPDC057543 TaxID=3346163 RepID=UPI00368C4DCC